MEKRLKEIIKEEVSDFFNNLDNHLETSEEKLKNRIEFLKKTYNVIPSDKPEERKAREAERKESEEQLKDVQDIDKEMEKKKKDMEDKQKEMEKQEKENVLNKPEADITTSTTTITGTLS